MNIVKYNEAQPLIAATQSKRTAVEQDIQQKTQAIMQDIRAKGWDGVVACSMEFDGTAPYEISQETLREAYDSIDIDLRRALERSRDQIFDYQKRIVLQDSEWDSPVGGRVGQLVRPLRRVGIYVPGGTAAYPSSVLMNAVPAKAAGVSEIIMVTPPTAHLKPSVLAAAYIAGVDRVFAVGGIQAVAALAYGYGIVPKVDKIVGPGNAYVAAAKSMVYGQVDIDHVAGPSEILVIADKTADPKFVAADFLSQAEHDALAQSILLTNSQQLIDAVRDELQKQLDESPRKEIAAQSIEGFGVMVVCDDLQQCAELSNVFAPEHLEIITENPRELLPLIKHAGAVFLGAYSPEPLGDYMAGPSHVLPTSGSARFFSPLSADSFLRRMSLIEFSRENLLALKDDIINIAEEEGLDAHANSVKYRFK
ncbi:MAG: histidinol dehydrogenase [Oscillospiraceae bacterium]|nr:histidinol dehydrogenase [Oscillospiraceae bacterium]